MQKRFLISVVALLAVLISAGGCGQKVDHGTMGEVNNIINQNRPQSQDQSQPAALNEEQKEQDNGLSADDYPGTEIDQAVNDMLKQMEDEQKQADNEKADEDAVKNDVNELNNLTQKYDEKEF